MTAKIRRQCGGKLADVLNVNCRQGFACPMLKRGSVKRSNPANCGHKVHDLAVDAAILKTARRLSH